jgi:hypothetical protein
MSQMCTCVLLDHRPQPHSWSVEAACTSKVFVFVIAAFAYIQMLPLSCMPVIGSRFIVDVT